MVIYLVLTGSFKVVFSSVLCCSLNSADSFTEFLMVFTTVVHVFTVLEKEFTLSKSVKIKFRA